MFKLDLKSQRNQRSNCQHPLNHRKSKKISEKTSTSASLTTLKPLTVRMTNLHSVLNSRDITLLTKSCIVKAMVFPIVMYGYGCWTIKKDECQRIDSFELCAGEDC